MFSDVFVDWSSGINSMSPRFTTSPAFASNHSTMASASEQVASVTASLPTPPEQMIRSVRSSHAETARCNLLASRAEGRLFFNPHPSTTTVCGGRVGFLAAHRRRTASKTIAAAPGTARPASRGVVKRCASVVGAAAGQYPRGTYCGKTPPRRSAIGQAWWA